METVVWLVLVTAARNSSPPLGQVNVIAYTLTLLLDFLLVYLPQSVQYATHYSTYAFSALTLLVGQQEGHPAYKN